MNNNAKKIFIAFILNFSFSIFEFIGGIITNSVAIISDSIHDMGDALSIGLSYFLEKKSMKKPDENYTYGYVRYSVMGSIITIIILIIGSIFVISNAIKRIINPVDINYNGMIIFAIVGFIVNYLAVYFTKDGHSLNQRAVNLHLLEDVLGWLVVLIGAIIMRFTDIVILDSILSIFVAIFILKHAKENLKKVIDIFLEKTPKGIAINEVKEHLLKLDGVKDIHHIHIWSLDGYNNYATMHAIIDDYNLNVKMLIKEELQKIGIGHATVELESENEKCREVECQLNENILYKHHH